MRISIVSRPVCSVDVRIHYAIAITIYIIAIYVLAAGKEAERKNDSQYSDMQFHNDKDIDFSPVTSVLGLLQVKIYLWNIVLKLLFKMFLTEFEGKLGKADF